MPISPKSFRSKATTRARGTKQQRGYGGEWERISRLKRQAYPMCEVCKDATADDVDHIIPFSGVSDPMRTDWRNLQSICRSCHNRKTKGR